MGVSCRYFGKLLINRTDTVLATRTPLTIRRVQRHRIQQRPVSISAKGVAAVRKCHKRPLLATVISVLQFAVETGLALRLARKVGAFLGIACATSLLPPCFGLLQI